MSNWNQPSSTPSVGGVAKPSRGRGFRPASNNNNSGSNGVGNNHSSTGNDNWNNKAPGGTSKNDDWNNGESSRKSNNNDWNNGGKPKNNSWNSGGASGKSNDWNTGGKSKNDDWNSGGSSGKSSNNDWNTGGKPKTDNWNRGGSSGKSNSNDWNNGGKSKNDDWSTGGKSKNDDWNTGGKSKNDDWNSGGSSGKSNNNDWNDGGKSKNDDWNNSGSGGKSNNDDWSNGADLNNDGSNNDNRGRRGGGRGGRGGGRGGLGDKNFSRKRSGDDDAASQGSEGFKKRRNNDDTEDGMDDVNTVEEKKGPVTYVPTERTDDDLFSDIVTVGMNFKKYNDIEVKISGLDPPPKVDTFAAMNLRKILTDNIERLCYKIPTPIQKHAFPIVRAGRDLMACAQTGSGKTGGYLLPMIQTLLEFPQNRELSENGCAPQVIILAPTRELVRQISEVARGFAYNSILKCATVYGGVQVSHQANRVKAGVDIVVATPGRLTEFIKSGTIVFSSIRFVVLDEADRMLDQGFLSPIESILEHSTMVPVASRQTLMFSATFSDNVQQLALKYLKPDYLFVVVGRIGGVCDDVEQIFYEVPFKEKRSKLIELLEADQNIANSKTIVFVEKKKTADFIAGYLSQKNFPSTSIHGDRLQSERETALEDFRSGNRSILLATSVAARGLDIKGITHVINYDLPKEIDEYVHRIGRTGRVGNGGKATSFFDPKDNDNLRCGLKTLLAEANLPIPECLEGGANDGFDAGGDFGGQDIRNNSGAVVEAEDGW